MFDEDVASLLEEFGSLMTLVRPGAAVYNPATGQMVSGTDSEPVEYDLHAVFVNYHDRNVDGTVIRAGDRQLLISAQGSTTAPEIDDVVGGLRVINVRTFAPNDVPVAYACHMRK